MSETRTYWASDPEYPVEDWQSEVANGNTRLGYAEWIASEREANATQEQLARREALISEITRVIDDWDLSTTVQYAAERMEAALALCSDEELAEEHRQAVLGDIDSEEESDHA